jgi:hypothetical protein
LQKNGDFFRILLKSAFALLENNGMKKPGVMGRIQPASVDDNVT